MAIHESSNRGHPQLAHGLRDPVVSAYLRIVDTHNLRAQGRAGATTYRYDDANRLMEAVTPEGTSSFDR